MASVGPPEEGSTKELSKHVPQYHEVDDQLLCGICSGGGTVRAIERANLERVLLSKLHDELDDLIPSMDGGGFGDPEAREHYQRKIDVFKFKITRRDNLRTAVVSTTVGAVVAAVVTILASVIDITVGRPVARPPPYRSRRAELPHRAPRSYSLRTW